MSPAVEPASFVALLASSATMTYTASTLMSGDEARDLAARQMLRPVPTLCRECGGTGSVGEPGYVHHGIPEPGSYEPCPDCPTVGQLLAIGAEAFDHRDYLWAAESC